MSFTERADKIFGGLAELKFQVVFFGKDAAYLECVKPVKLDGDEMVFRAGGNVLTISGENLAVKELSDRCIAIVGKITKYTAEEL